MRRMSHSFSSIPDVSSGVPRGPYSGCCPSWGWRLMVDVCPCAWVDVCPCAHDVCRSWGSLAQVRLLICHQIAPRARLVNLPSVHTRAPCHTSVHTRYVQCHTHLYNATQVKALPHHIKRTTMHTCRRTPNSGLSTKRPNFYPVCTCACLSNQAHMPGVHLPYKCPDIKGGLEVFQIPHRWLKQRKGSK